MHNSPPPDRLHQKLTGIVRQLIGQLPHLGKGSFIELWRCQHQQLSDAPRNANTVSDTGCIDHRARRQPHLPG